VPLVKQQGQPWSTTKLGTSNTTIGANGCALCCMTMLLRTNGVNVDPGVLNTWLVNNGGFASSNLIIWSKAAQYPGSTFTWVGTADLSLSMVKSEIDAGNPVIISINNAMHFVCISGYTGPGTDKATFIVLDPLKDGQHPLTDYATIDGIRIFHNVSKQTLPSCTFSVTTSGAASIPLAAGWMFWQLTNTSFYRVSGVTQNLPAGWNYSIWLANETGTPIAQILGNQSAGTFDFVFTVSAPYNTGSKYTFLFCGQGQQASPWTKSSWFYMSQLPTISISVTPSLLLVGQRATLTWKITGGIPGLANGGWTGQIQVQWQKDGIPMSNLAMLDVSTGSLTFSVPEFVDGVKMAGTGFQLSGSNPAGSGIPTGTVFAYSSKFEIKPVPPVSISAIKPGITHPGYDGKISIYSLTGKMMKFPEAVSVRELAEIKLLPAGTYFMQTQNSNNVQTRKLFMK
jgi:hypothetical protein